jgi:hypothetical protein
MVLRGRSGRYDLFCVIGLAPLASVGGATYWVVKDQI